MIVKKSKKNMIFCRKFGILLDYGYEKSGL